MGGKNRDNGYAPDDLFSSSGKNGNAPLHHSTGVIEIQTILVHILQFWCTAGEAGEAGFAPGNAMLPAKKYGQKCAGTSLAARQYAMVEQAIASPACSTSGDTNICAMPAIRARLMALP